MIQGQNPLGQNPPDNTPWTKPLRKKTCGQDHSGQTPPDKTPPDETHPDKTSHQHKTPRTQITTANFYHSKTMEIGKSFSHTQKGEQKWPVTIDQ